MSIRQIRDPVWGLIRFESNPLDSLLASLIDTPEFQRLRRIKQLGFSDMVFPAATHTRFAHSVGVMQSARVFLEHIGEVKDEHRAVVLVAALLHDIGHGPFSHTFERITGLDHEEQTAKIIRDRDRTIYTKLANYDTNLPDAVANIFSEEVESPYEDFPNHLRHIISSQFDCDRSDYLLRDSRVCGVRYGQFDLRWLLSQAVVREGEAGTYLAFSPKSQQALEEYVLARYHMYQGVYFHKTTRAAELILKFLAERVAIHVREGGSLCDFGVSSTPSTQSLESLFRKDGTINDLIAVDDVVMGSVINTLSQCDSKAFSFLSQSLIRRELFKPVNVDGMNDNQKRQLDAEMQKIVNNLAQKTELPAQNLVLTDSPSDIPYRLYYKPDESQVGEQLWVEQSADDDVAELTQQSGVASALMQQVTLSRWYCPPCVRTQVDQKVREIRDGGGR